MDDLVTWLRRRTMPFVAILAALLIVAGCTGQTADTQSEAGAAQATVTPALASAGESDVAQDAGTPEPAIEATQTPTAAPATATPSGTADAAQASGAEVETTYAEYRGGGGGRNIVRVNNRVDNRLTVKGSIQLNTINSPTVAPGNLAYAYASCVDCQTFAIALQINLIPRNANYVAPENAAVAVNVECTRCYTVARAIQYTYSVDDPNQVPQEVRDLINEMDRELKSMRNSRDLTAAEAEERINAVIERFRTLAESLNDQRDVATEQTTPDASATPAP
jgi:hypothetical protein